MIQSEVLRGRWYFYGIFMIFLGVLILVFLFVIW